jgi:SAM-dependent methyltransferase
MELPAFNSLFTPSGEQALADAVALEPKEADFLRHFTALSRDYPAETARAALDTAIFRLKAATKFGDLATRLYFTREALEQASSAPVAAWRSSRYKNCGTVVDLGCSVGGDTLALALRPGAVRTVGIDRDPLRLAMAAANANAVGVGERTEFVLADLESAPPFAPDPAAALFFDPGRRSGERRARSVSDYQPPLDVIRAWLSRWPALGVKIAPGVRMEELAGYDAEVEFISLGGELREAVLWFGPLRREGGPRRATVLPGGHTMCGVPDLEGGAWSRPPRLGEPEAWLYEPDPAVIRAGLVRQLGDDLDARQLDPSIVFLTSGTRVDTPFARALAVEDWMPFNQKRLKAYLRERGIGRVTVKKRGSPLDADRLARDLRTKGDEERLVVLTRLDGKPVAIVCR